MVKIIGGERNAQRSAARNSRFIKALIAPRCYLETNGYGDIWANPRGSYLSLMAAKEVWKFYGAEDKCACWYREDTVTVGQTSTPSSTSWRPTRTERPCRNPSPGSHTTIGDHGAEVMLSRLPEHLKNCLIAA